MGFWTTPGRRPAAGTAFGVEQWEARVESMFPVSDSSELPRPRIATINQC
jgi:hypothetical protein